jgi:RNA polymerase sigma-70 factor (ECF subfamily)
VSAHVEPVVNDADRAVVEEAQRGSHRAFRAMVERFDPGLRSLAFRLLGSQTLMEDVLQDAYVKAYRALPSFRGESSPGTWLYRITYNACLDELRRQRKVVELPLAHAAHRPDPRPEPGERFGLRSTLTAAMDDLPPAHRAAVLLVDGHGFDYAEAADVLGIPEGTLRSRLSRARARLRDALHDDHANEDVR